MLWPSQHR